MLLFKKTHQSTTAGTASAVFSNRWTTASTDLSLAIKRGWLRNPRTKWRFLAWKHHRSESRKFIEANGRVSRTPLLITGKSPIENQIGESNCPVPIIKSNLKIQLSSTPIFTMYPTWTRTHKITQQKSQAHQSLGVAGGRFDQGFPFMPTVPEGENVSSPAEQLLDASKNVALVLECPRMGPTSHLL